MPRQLSQILLPGELEMIRAELAARNPTGWSQVEENLALTLYARNPDLPAVQAVDQTRKFALDAIRSRNKR